jgi:tRNA G18 (ribose-2'-O)-methylase SpoU
MRIMGIGGEFAGFCGFRRRVDRLFALRYNRFSLYFTLCPKETIMPDSTLHLIREITDLSAPELDVFARLTQAQLRNRLEPEKGIFIAESPKVIGTALDAGYTPVSLLMERSKIDTQAKQILARCPADVPVYTGPREVLAQLTGYELTRGVLCAMRRPKPKSLDELCVGARRLAVLEGIVDSTNIGAIFRSAAALGIDAVLLSPTCCDPLCRRAVRVSMGTVFQVPWGYFGGENAAWPQPALARLRALGFKTAAMALREDSIPLDDARLAGEEKLAIVLGTEGTGLAADTIASCDYTVLIPMAHHVDSLNVAAASAVAFWQLRGK